MLSLLVASALTAYPGNAYPVKICGSRHMLALLNNGEVIGWGRPDNGQLGPIAAIPIRNYGTRGLVKVKLPKPAKDIAAGYETTVALLQDGTVVALGADTCGFMGGLRLPSGVLGSENPVPVPGLDHIVKVEASNKTFLAVNDKGDVYMWGDRTPFGDGKVPAKVPGLSHIVDVSVRSACLALDNTGHVYSWYGADWSGILGRLDNVDGVGIIKGLDKVVSIAAGNCMAMAVRSDGSVWTWGSSYQAQLGNGTHTDPPVRGGLSNDIQVTPKPVKGISNAVKVYCSQPGFGFALLRDGTVKGWGNTQLRQLTFSTNDGYQETPAKVNISGVKSIWAGSQNGYAIKTDGSLWVWGDNFQSGFPLSKVTGTPTRIVLP